MFAFRRIAVLLPLLIAFPAAAQNRDAAEKLAAKGVDLRSQRRYPDAITYFRQATEADSQYSGGWYGLGLCLREVGETREAQDALEQADSVEPKNAAILHQLGMTYAQRGKFRLAIDTFKDAQAADSSYLAAYEQQGWACLAAGDVDGAKAALRVLATVDENNEPPAQRLSRAITFFSTPARTPKGKASNTEASFETFSVKLRNVSNNRDSAGLMELLAKDVRTDNGTGATGFKGWWSLPSKNSSVWEVMQLLLDGESAMKGADRVFPASSVAFPYGGGDTLVPYGYTIADGVKLYVSPATDAESVSLKAHESMLIDSAGSIRSPLPASPEAPSRQNYSWFRVARAGGGVGYIQSQDVWLVSDYTLIARKVRGQWKIASLTRVQ